MASSAKNMRAAVPERNTASRSATDRTQISELVQEVRAGFNGYNNFGEVKPGKARFVEWFHMEWGQGYHCIARIRINPVDRAMARADVDDFAKKLGASLSKDSRSAPGPVISYWVDDKDGMIVQEANEPNSRSCSFDDIHEERHFEKDVFVVEAEVNAYLSPGSDYRAHTATREAMVALMKYLQHKYEASADWTNRLRLKRRKEETSAPETNTSAPNSD